MSLILATRNPVVRRHGKKFHVHHSHKVLISTLYVDGRVNGKVRKHKVGHYCPMCGFIPNDVAKRMQQQALDAINGVS